jgi:hypothetical protein
MKPPDLGMGINPQQRNNLGRVPAGNNHNPGFSEFENLL